MKPILEIQHVSKRFILNSAEQPYLSLRDSLTGIFKPSARKEDFWALDDVNLDIYEGDTVGIIGKNGAGKSTLLKILSRITPPTSGKIISRGRIASLLEVGTGFHPELTGRENVYMNGSILGMRRKEIDRNFDAIIDFAGIERFVDTPLKHYSSGMQLRLAFAVAAFLENEILIIDEVLAVGDAEFQKKCMNKMGDISQSGRTILFVSHNMGAIRQLCQKTVYLKAGKVVSFGTTNEILTRYSTASEAGSELVNGTLLPTGKIIRKVELKCDHELSSTFYSGCDFRLAIDFEHDELLSLPVLGIIFRNEYDEPLIGINNKHYMASGPAMNVQSGKLEMHIPFFPLYVGNYTIDIHFGDGYSDIAVLKSACSFNVTKGGLSKALELPDEKHNRFLINQVNWNFYDESHSQA